MNKFVSTYQRITKAGEERGEKRGRAAGRAEGKAEGSAEVLLLLLRKRFGPLSRTTVARVRKAASPQLTRWAERLLTAERLAAVFA